MCEWNVGGVVGGVPTPLRRATGALDRFSMGLITQCVGFTETYAMVSVSGRAALQRQIRSDWTTLDLFEENRTVEGSADWDWNRDTCTSSEEIPQEEVNVSDLPVVGRR